MCTSIQVDASKGALEAILKYIYGKDVDMGAEHAVDKLLFARGIAKLNQIVP